MIVRKRRLVVITGVTRGLGRAMLDRFVEAGWTVAGCSRSAAGVDELRRRFGDGMFLKWWTSPTNKP
jgi:NAD(P)-dependent dehydrogenase (short-subunit alcohol dehydrogenase family)